MTQTNATFEITGCDQQAPEGPALVPGSRTAS